MALSYLFEDPLCIFGLLLISIHQQSRVFFLVMSPSWDRALDAGMAPEITSNRVSKNNTTIPWTCCVMGIFLGMG